MGRSAPAGRETGSRTDRGSAPAREPKRWRWGLALGAWVGAVIVSMAFLVSYSFDAGEAADAPVAWPETSGLEHAGRTHELVMVAHPKCSCTRASLGELARLMRRLPALHATVVFILPEGGDRDWESSDLWDAANRIPRVDVVPDPGGATASAFGAHTSGSTLLFDAQRRMVFSGGLTPSRAHEGNSTGRQQIVALVTAGESELAVSAVFGCPLAEGEAPRGLLARLGVQ